MTTRQSRRKSCPRMRVQRPRCCFQEIELNESARFSEFLSLSCFVILPVFLRPTVWCGVVCLISSSCLRFFFVLSSCASSVWFRFLFTLCVFGFIQGPQGIFVWVPVQSDHARAYELASLQGLDPVHFCLGSCAVRSYLGIQKCLWVSLGL
jgi:hypothetical protein